MSGEKAMGATSYGIEAYEIDICNLLSIIYLAWDSAGRLKGHLEVHVRTIV